MPLLGVTSTAMYGESAALLTRIITPALAHPSVFVWEVTRALTLPSPGRFVPAKWNWSDVPQMSPPAPWIVHVPLLSDWVPAGVGLPMSAQLHPLGQAAGVMTVSKVAVLIEAAWDV